MKDFDQKKLEALLAENKLAEAKEYIQAVLMADPDVKADAAIEYALAYVKTANSVNADYLKSLKETIALLKKTKASESRTDDKIKLAKLKADLGIKK